MLQPTFRRIALHVFVLVGLALFWHHPARAKTAELAIVGATLIDGTGGPPRPDSWILVRDGRIAAVSTAAEGDPPAGIPVIDASGKYVMPGLADMHVHFGLGSPVPAGPEIVLARELYYGVTSILQLGGA